MHKNIKKVEEVKSIETSYFDEDGIEHKVSATFRIYDDGRLILKSFDSSSPTHPLVGRLSYREILHAVQEAYREDREEI